MVDLRYYNRHKPTLPWTWWTDERPEIFICGRYEPIEDEL